MAEKLKIIPLGGLNEIGKNLTVYEYGNDIIIVDVGMGFPDDDMYGVEVEEAGLYTVAVTGQGAVGSVDITVGQAPSVQGT